MVQWTSTGVIVEGTASVYEATLLCTIRYQSGKEEKFAITASLGAPERGSWTLDRTVQSLPESLVLEQEEMEESRFDPAGSTLIIRSSDLDL